MVCLLLWVSVIFWLQMLMAICVSSLTWKRNCLRKLPSKSTQ
jgi:hypothetical protein